ncbi:MAG: hypothetical protein SF052_15235 [Bacteroidia bacterium]|nr:hypothetical protein [Bacteroidia bacterium]
MAETPTSDVIIFTTLFKEVYQKCFEQPLEKQPLESEYKHLSNDIEEKTGLVVGWKSLKNYGLSILEEKPRKPVNPSSATLDTLSRYVLAAPAITEAQRKKLESPYGYWFVYRDQLLKTQVKQGTSISSHSWRKPGLFLLLLFIGISLLIVFQPTGHFKIEEYFQRLEEKDLSERGWFLLNPEDEYWNKRAFMPGQMTLFTLPGDNWRTKENKPHIYNLLCREIPTENFSTEVHFSNFIPLENWQQAGLLLMEDTLFKGKSIRISIAYNDYFGGFSRPGEILVQAIASHDNDYANIEEVIHYPLFAIDSTIEKSIIGNNLKYSALRIEKHGQTYRFLYAASPFENFSFKEAGRYDFNMKPRYVGIFALRGFVDSDSVMPVSVRFFRLENLDN